MMELETLLPLAFGSGKIKDGFLVPLPKICTQECKSSKCITFHRQVMNTDGSGLRKCHRGYAVCKTYVNGMAASFVGLRVKHLSPMSCFNESGILKRQFSESDIEALIRQSEWYIERQVRINNQNRYLPDLIHSLAKILDSADSNGHYIVEQMLKDQEDRDYVSIGETAITVGLAAIQARAILYQANVQTFGTTGEQTISMRVYSKFVRASRTLRYLRKNARIERFDGTVVDDYRLTPSFGMVPYLIFDNALKYSPKGGAVNVIFSEDDQGLDIEVSNVGPYIPEDCLNKIWENGYRTEGAKKFTTEGSGIGLCTVSSILAANKIKVKVTSEQIDGVKFNGTHMGKFKILIHIPTSLRCRDNDESGQI